MTTNDTKCSCGKTKYIGREVCYDCYADMFNDYKANKDPKFLVDADEEPDFEIKSDVATISASNVNSDFFYVKNGDSLIRATSINFKNPKHMVFNPDARVKDYEKLVLFLLENMTIYDNAKGFEKVSYMFKEADK